MRDFALHSSETNPWVQAAIIWKEPTPTRTAASQLEDGVPLSTHKWCAHAFEQARGGSGAWYAMELTELLPHVARGLNINWDEAIRYAGLNAESCERLINASPRKRSICAPAEIGLSTRTNLTRRSHAPTSTGEGSGTP